MEEGEIGLEDQNTCSHLAQVVISGMFVDRHYCPTCGKEWR